MIKKILLALLLLSGMQTYSQDKQTIAFKTQSWSEALAAAKSSHQLIFVDVYTEWCGPCKKMEREVFILPDVAKLFNSTFINFKLDAEKGIGPAMQKKYGVSSYPTYLFVNGDGTLIYSMDGSMEPSTFKQHANNAVLEAQQEQNIDQLEALYTAHKDDQLLLYNYLNRLTKLKLPTADLLDRYVGLLTPKEQSDPKTIQLIIDNGAWLNRKLQVGPAMTVLENNTAVFDQLQKNNPRREPLEQIKKGAIDVSMRKAIANKDVILFQKLVGLKQESKTNPFDNKETFAMRYYFAVNDYPAYKKRATQYISQVVLKIPADTLVKQDAEVYTSMRSSPDSASYKHTATIKVTRVLMNTVEDMLSLSLSQRELQQINGWAVEALRMTSTDPDYYKDGIPFYINLYAQVLYKMNQKAKAIQQMKSAMQLVSGNDYAMKKLQAVLSRMETNEAI